MLNIEIQTCGLVLDLVLIYFLQRHEHVGLISERLFRISLAVNLALIILDINSIIFIVNDARLPAIAVEIACKIYLVSLVMASMMGFVYASMSVQKLRKNKPFRFSINILFIIATVLIMCTKVKYTHAERIVYSFGPSAKWTYAFAPLFIISSLVITIVYRKQINTHRKRAVRAWMLLAMIAASIQFVNPRLLLVGFASALGMLILYAELENPVVNLDQTTGVFSYNCLSDYLIQLYENRQRFACAAVCLGQDWHVDRDTQHQILLEISDYLRGFSDAKIFRGLGNDFLMLYEPDEETKEYDISCRDDIGFIRQRFDRPFEDTDIRVSFMYIPDNLLFRDSEEFLTIYQDYRTAVMDDKKGTLKINEDVLQKSREFGRIKHEIVSALEEDRIEVYLQPIYSVEEDRFISAEALARLRNRDGSIMMPGLFIPVAEESGLIENVGERVFRKTCGYMEESLKDIGIKYVEVNLSTLQCENEDLAEKYRDILNDHDILPNVINLEITESSALNKRDILLNNMDRLIKSGVSFAIDDFGTGESNLNYIVDMPVDIIKIDYTMTQSYFKSERARIVMNATVKLIKDLGLRIVAEGVETKEQLEAMKKIGIDYIQGFYFSKPLPYSEFIGFIEKNNLDSRVLS